MRHFTGMQYLQMDIAANYGLDKATWDERLEWYQTNKKTIEEGSEEETKNFLRLADKPAQVMAGIFAMRDTLKGKPTGYMCGLDATASGLQILSTLIGCEKSASLCNLIGNGFCNDAYTHAHNYHRGLSADLQVTRKQYKAALMTHLYGSVKEPEIVFGKGTEELSNFYRTIEQMLPGADALNRWLLQQWDPTKSANHWILPDGFNTYIKVMAVEEIDVMHRGALHHVKCCVNAPTPTSKSLGANIVHSIDGMVVREMARRCNYNKKRLREVHDELLSIPGQKCMETVKDIEVWGQVELWRDTGFLSWRIFDELSPRTSGHLTVDERRHLINTLERIFHDPFELVAIHDCFRFAANNGNDVRKIYRSIFAELAESHVLRHIASTLTGHDVPKGPAHAQLAAKIRQSEYAIS